MQPDLNRVIEQVSKEKGIDRQIIVRALEEAMLSAAKKTFGHEKNIEAKFNTDLGEVELFEIKTVVENVEDPENQITLEEAHKKLDPEAEMGDELLAKLPAEKFGRIAAQAAKQNIIQRVRDAERDIIYNEFKGRKGELFSGIVQRFEKKNIIVNLGRTDAILPEKEQIPRERYRQGDRIRAFIFDVELTSKGPQIVLSRTHPGLLIKLFEQEVPEIYEGIVEVKGAAREPGGRAKIAVTSNDSDVDPVGACVGMRGTRVQAVVQELRGEKIDIVPWTGTRPSTCAVRSHRRRCRRSSWTRTTAPWRSSSPTTSSPSPSARRGRTSASRRGSRAGSSTCAASPRPRTRRGAPVRRSPASTASATSRPSSSTRTASSRRKRWRRPTRRRSATSTASAPSVPLAS
jgi:transcription termination factor NusA